MKIAFLGDSITFGYALENKSDRYSTLVCEAIGAEEVNLGITGTLIARAGLNRTDGNSFLDRLPLIKNADVAVIFGGTNDYFWSDRPICAPDGNTSEEYFKTALTAICRRAAVEFSTVKLLLVTPYPHHGVGNYQGGGHWRDSSEHDTDVKNYNGHVLQDYVNSILQIGAEFNIPTLNLHDAFGWDWREHTLDGCHPNEEGHRILAERIGLFLTEQTKGI